MARGASKFYKDIPSNKEAVKNVERRIDLLGQTWTVTFPAGHSYADGKIVFGWCANATHEISVGSANIARSVQRSVLIHELTHAMLFSQGIGGIIDHTNYDEVLANAMETGWFQFLREPKNRWVIKFIQEEV